MKKLLSLSLALLTAISLTACAGSAPQSTGSAPSAQASGSPSAASQSNVTLSGEIGGEVNISCYDSMQYEALLQEAAEKFEAMYPGTKINISTFSAPPEVKTMEKDGMKVAMITNQRDPQAENDYVFKVGNEIMSGQGADIYAMDILPYYKYIEGGYLEDLSGYMNADSEFDQSAYASNILNSIKYNGGQYVMPLSYSFNVLTYDPEILGNSASNIFNEDTPMPLSKAIELTAEIADSYNAGSTEPVKLINMAAPELFNKLFKDNYESFVDTQNKTADFNSGSFASLLDTVKEYNDKGYLPETAFGAVQKGPGPGGSPGAAQPKIKGSETPQAPSYDDIQKQMSSQVMLGMQPGMSLLSLLNKGATVTRMFTTSGAAGGSDHDIGTVAANAAGEVEAEISNIFGINANSKNKETAWAFIKFLLSDEMQQSMNLRSLPLKNDTRNEKARLEILDQYFIPSEERVAIELNEEQKALYDEYVAYVEKYTEKIGAYAPAQEKIIEIVNTETKLFWNGEKSAEDTASAIQTKVTLYLNE